MIVLERVKNALRAWRTSERPPLRGAAAVADRSASLLSQVQSRPQPMSKLMAELYDRNPYQGFYRPLSKDLQTWGGDRAIFGEMVEQIRPALVIEVGTWKGGSAISMGSRMKQLGLEGQVLCVDTWLGSIEHWLAKDAPERRSWYQSLRLEHGYPHLYDQFLVNVIYAGLQDVIVPFPATSRMAAEWLQLKGIKADLIYIDAGHGEDDVFDDLIAYHGLLDDGGILFGDDWNWGGVQAAVNRFATERALTIETAENDMMWVLRS